MDTVEEDGTIIKDKGTPNERRIIPEGKAFAIPMPKATEMKITVDSEQMLKMKEELESVKQEKENLKSELEIIADKQLQAKAKKYNLDPDLPSETLIKKIERIEENEPKIPPAGICPVVPPDYSKKSVNSGNNDFNQFLPLELRLYNDYQAMSRDLVKEAQSGSKESDKAKAMISELNLKAIGKSNREPFSMEIDPREIKSLRTDTKRENAQKMLKKDG